MAKTPVLAILSAIGLKWRRNTFFASTGKGSKNGIVIPERLSIQDVSAPEGNLGIIFHTSLKHVATHQ